MPRRAAPRAHSWRQPDALALQMLDAVEREAEGKAIPESEKTFQGLLSRGKRKPEWCCKVCNVAMCEDCYGLWHKNEYFVRDRKHLHACQ